MRNWRIITAAAAVVLAMLAAVLVYQYLNKADERAADKVEQVEVFVATQSIPKGTSIEDAVNNGLIEPRDFTRKDVPPSAVSSTDGLEGSIAASDIAEGQVVVASSFASPSTVSGRAGEIDDGKQAISIQVDPERGVANWIEPADQINVIVTFEYADLTAPDKAPLTTTAFLLPGIEVIGVGSTTVSTTTPEGEQTTTENAGLLTLQVTARQAEQLAHAKSNGAQIYVTLNAPGFDAEEFEIPAEIVEAVNWFDQELTTARQAMDAQRAASDPAGG